MMRSLTCLWLLLLLLVAFHTNAEAETLASGDGFSITSEYVDAQKAFFSRMGFQSDDVEHLKAALKMRLFALEGLSMGIIDRLPEDATLPRERAVQQYNEIFEKVVAHLIETYPIPEDAIHSYYMAYPDKFLKRLDTPKENIRQEDVMPLDDTLKKWIHDKIARPRKAAIIDDEFERLKQKYHVVIEAQ